jgi:hypothetical protein
VVVGQDELLQCRIVILGAPELAEADPEHLENDSGCWKCSRGVAI